MEPFWRSIQLSASVSGCVFAPLMALSFVWAHLSLTSTLAKIASTSALVLALPILVFSILGIISSLRSRPFFSVASDAHMSRLAVATVVLSVSGIFTLGVASIAGIVVGIFALRTICRRRDSRGQKLAVIGLCISSGVIGFLSSLLLIGP